ncbi:MAG: flavin reductase family protein [Candidatus Scalindua sp. AMX11]|nr:MAG: flavin reductase family protein [Candidatus Scalindua sp.]NOG85672.1 flavin reductase family protein [Planctomycetota bacterium]RZV82435.1 MAG: flavin reductase family protein [Candidatus Scalindua sp. SCAELEC01]TDE65643.1 MAG: flavin reductase family protein [Candidatus Scalindua sp. AMX11]GJQ59159.1 MAG: flavodoxin [Candidatus Scalindua sp.]
MKKSLGAKTIAFPTPTFIVGTYDSSDKANAMNVAWGGICCSKPPCVSISLRKSRQSYKNIVERKAFTINIPSETYIKEADYFGIVSGADEDKFSKTGLTPTKSDQVDAPYISEFPFIIECKLLHTIEIGLHTQFIGEIIDVKAEESVLENGNDPDIERIKPVFYSPGTRTYYGVGKYLGKAFSLGKEI